MLYNRYVVVKRNRSKEGRARSNITDDSMMTVRRENTEMESSLQYYTNMTSDNDLCVEDGDYASVSSNPRYSVGLTLRENKKRLVAADSHPQEDFKSTEDPSATDDVEGQDQSKSDEEGIYEEPTNFVEYLQIVGNESEAAAAVDDHVEK